MKPISISTVGARTKSALTWVGSLGLALCLVSTPTYASEFSIPANTGYALDHPKCFHRDESSIINNVCLTTDKIFTDHWVIPLIVPFTGHHYRVTVRAKTKLVGLSTTCSLFAFDGQGGISTGGNDGTSFSGAFEALVLNEHITVLASNDPLGPTTLQVNCAVARDGGALLSVELVNLD